MLLLSFGSGVAALIYEIVWFQLLELVIGSTAVSLGILLATFMGGMCLGSLILPRLSPPGVILCACTPRSSSASAFSGFSCCCLMPLGGRRLHGLERIWPARIPASRSRRGRRAFCLPTLLMGATLPALARQVERRPRRLVAGFLLRRRTSPERCSDACFPGFYLLRVYDVATATYVAVGGQRGGCGDRVRACGPAERSTRSVQRR